MSSGTDTLRTRIKRIPQQERSLAKFEAVVGAALQLFGEVGYEAVSMREIARVAELPIASVYQYFPTKIAVVREIWSRYALAVRERLARDMGHITQRAPGADPGELIEDVVNLMARIQTDHPAYMAVWGCVASDPDLRALNAADTLATAHLIGQTIHALHPSIDNAKVKGLALVLCEAASSITKLALALEEPARTETLEQLKQTLRFIYRSATYDLTTAPHADILAK